MQSQAIVAEGSNNIDLTVESLQAGLYVITIVDNNNVSIHQTFTKN